MIRKTIKQAGIFAAGKFLARVFSFIAFVYIARRIGPDHFGVYTYISALVGTLIAFSSLGMLGEVLRKSRELGEDAIKNSFLVYFLSNLIGSLIALVFIFVRGYSGILGALGGLLLMSRAVYDLTSVFHFVRGRIRYVTFATIGDRAIFTLLVFVLPPKTSSLLIASITSLVLTGVFLYSRMKFRPRWKLDFSYISIPFLLNGIFLPLGEKIPVLIYDIKFSIGNLGIFGAAMTLYSAGAMIFTEIFRYVQVRAGKMDEKNLGRLKNLTLLASGGALVGFAIFKPFVKWFASLVYGPSYAGVGTLFFMLSFSIAAMLAGFYPRIRVFYESPWLYAFASFTFAVASSTGALLASSIEQGALFYTLSQLAYAGAWWLAFAKIKNLARKPSI